MVKFHGISWGQYGASSCCGNTRRTGFEKILMEMDWSPKMENFSEFLAMAPMDTYGTYGTYVHQTQFQKGSLFYSLGLWIRNDLCSENLLTSNTWLRKDGSPPRKKRGRSATIKDSVPHNKHTWCIYIIKKSYNPYWIVINNLKEMIKNTDNYWGIINY